MTGPLTNLDILFAPDYAGRLTYLTELRDTVGLSALRLGIDPTTITQEQFQAALAEVQVAVDSGHRAQHHRATAMSTTWPPATSCWPWPGPATSSAPLLPAQTDDQDFQWTLADQGGMLWTDNMAIPKGAVNKAQAQAFINWYYTPANAAEIGASVQYVCPVKGAGRGDAWPSIPTLAANTLIFPDADDASRGCTSSGASTSIPRRRGTQAFDEVIGL